MRNNQPVTQQEYRLAPDATLMSTTDTNSHIQYANAAFTHASGYSHEQLIGQPHNLVRHPDMPAEAFADMWATLKAGEPWTGLVKNRRANGDHYWVRANAVPVVRGGQQVGHMSVRTAPSRAEIDSAELLYRRMREGKLSGHRLHKGVLVRKGLGALFSAGKTLGVRARIRLLIVQMAFMSVGGALLVRSMGGQNLAVLLTVMLAATGTSVLLERQIAKPLEAVKDAALKVATGESQESVHLDRVDEIGTALRTVNQLGLMFRWLISDVAGQVQQVQTAVNEIAHGNVDLSARTEQAAANVEETSASMDQMSQSVANNAEAAAKAKTLASSATDVAQSGGAAVEQVVKTMSGITRSSEKIADIISVIDGIAFQTNILALNAAVEAARAGEQGRGFAVVAGEVRTLAQRSAQAAKEIKDLITQSVSQVREGSALVDDAGQTMADIVSQVKRVSEMIDAISSATSNQTLEIAQMTQAVDHFDNITQQNAALVEQGAAASDSLRQQTAHLAEAVAVFR